MVQPEPIIPMPESRDSTDSFLVASNLEFRLHLALGLLLVERTGPGLRVRLDSCWSWCRAPVDLC